MFEYFAGEADMEGVLKERQLIACFFNKLKQFRWVFSRLAWTMLAQPIDSSI